MLPEAPTARHLEAAIITRWRQDPFARGSYSYLPAGFDPAARTALRSDVDGRVFFAGEATSDDYAGTVHGAWFEGTAAADRIAAVAAEGDEIAVIGAGIAGLAAAKQLTDAGYDVVVLEGRDRIGGRLHTDESLGVSVELGAGWIHGADDNPLLELAERAGVRTVVPDGDDMIVYDTDGNEVDDDDIEAIVATLGEPQPRRRTHAGRHPRRRDRWCRRGDRGAGSVRPGVGGRARRSREHQRPDGSFDRVGQEFTGADVVLPDGYVRILGPLLDGVAVDVGQVVVSIAHDADGVLIGLGGGTTVQSDRVLVTVPLGVLKAGDIEFDPPLPTEKQAAIAELGMGVLDRVVLQFDERFWDDTTDRRLRRQRAGVVHRVVRPHRHRRCARDRRVQRGRRRRRARRASPIRRSSRLRCARCTRSTAPEGSGSVARLSALSSCSLSPYPIPLHSARDLGRVAGQPCSGGPFPDVC